MSSEQCGEILDEIHECTLDGDHHGDHYNAATNLEWPIQAGDYSTCPGDLGR